MRRLIKHIEQLLYREECVVVPGLGAFILHQETAVADEPKGLIYPGRSHISFNGALNHNDGLLVQSYSDAFSFGYKRSLSLLESDVQELRSQLLSTGVVQMGEMGKLMQTRGEEHIRFIPNEAHPFSIDHYGLQPVAMLPSVTKMSLSADSKPRRKGDVYYLPINLKHLAYGSAAAAMVALALLIPNQKLSIPSDVAQYQAGFVTAKAVEEPTPAPVVDTTPRVDGFEIVRHEEGKGRYYVVVATLSSEKQMIRFIAEHPEIRIFAEEGGVLVSQRGLHRIFAKSFEDAAEAQAFLTEIARDKAYSTSWVHKQ
ncbi:MAG: SPOR domain-containing protein [Bacteroidales bacterium]|uniref:HU domain-containing protein n=1 Tax=Porphyromonas sp. TaxID=1924944 RepID=UPI0029706084|nr:SPOR domain-containing protein [Porphyromonas sp.]MDD7437490.1 SPOR domain-containing protein [Bacteroidales bacterium]MDY3067521.1 SPOR domain-containing protein [Porphyromonas sp.]